MSIIFPVGRKVSDRRYHESGVRGRYEPNLRVVRGRIDTTTPTILEGVGFSVVKDATAQVTLTFDPAYSAAFSIVGTVDRTVGTTGRWLFVQGSITPTTVQLGRTDAADTYVDGTFYFIVVGPIT